MNLSVVHLPTVNAALNGTSALLLAVGYLFIRRRKVFLHTVSMGSAFFVSILFLISYLTYHAHYGSKPFPGAGWIRPVYFSILISHTLLAILVVPLAVRTLYLALHSRFEEHKRISHWTWPIWMYVSITGVIVYWMLYRMEWP